MSHFIKDFDWQYYLSIHKDLRRNGICTKRQALNHYIKYGVHEKREYKRPVQGNVHKDVQEEIFHNGQFNHKMNDIYNTVVYIFSNILSGGSLKYVIDLSHTLDLKGIPYILIRNKKELNYYQTYMRRTDILLVSHLFNSDVPMAYVNNVIGITGVRLFTLCHDMVLLRLYQFNSNNVTQQKITDPCYKDDRVNDIHTLQFFRQSEFIICPSQYLMNKFKSSLPDCCHHRLVFSLHIDNCLYDRKVYIPPIIKNNKVKIGIISEISEFKGIEKILSILENPHLENKVSFHIFSCIFISQPFRDRLDVLTKKPDPNVFLHEPYKEEEIYSLLNKHSIHGLLLLNKWPETYCYGLSKIINSGRPFLYSDIEGAVKERILLDSSRPLVDRALPYDDALSTDRNIQRLIDLITLSDFDSMETNLSDIPPQHRFEIPPFYESLFSGIQPCVEKLYENVHQFVEPFAIYFPQFHQIKENDLNFYEGMTDMVSLRHLYNDTKMDNENVLPNLPLPGFLGEYDLDKDRQVVPLQVQLAQRYGFKGFGIYHYWFSDNNVTNRHRLMEKVIDQFFQETYPSFRVFLIWANENWSGNLAFSCPEERRIANRYDDESFQNHLKDLLPLFSHPNYLRYDNRPVFYIHHPFLMTPQEIQRFNALATNFLQQHGFDGIYLVLNNIHPPLQGGPPKEFLCYNHHPDYFGLRCGGDIHLQDYITHNMNLPASLTPCIESVFSSFDCEARFYRKGGKRKHLWKTVNDGPKVFKNWLSLQFKKYSSAPRTGPLKMFLVNAWNEWGENMTIEPSQKYSFEYLKMFRQQLFDSFS